MRKKTCLLLCLLVLLSLALSGCGGKKELTDGSYTVAVTLSGGSGKAKVESPARLVIAGETMTATVVWSSKSYEYMVVDGVRYDPVQTQGNATFEIPVVLDADMKVSACTLAMSTPHEVDYTLRFDSASIKGA